VPREMWERMPKLLLEARFSATIPQVPRFYFLRMDNPPGLAKADPDQEGRSAKGTTPNHVMTRKGNKMYWYIDILLAGQQDNGTKDLTCLYSRAMLTTISKIGFSSVVNSCY
jgi:hypothetical protein